MQSHLFELPGDFSGQVRLFPLPDLVLFPGIVQALHIFESRYREMLEDALEGDQLITLATLEPGYTADYYSRPAIAGPVCIGRVTNHSQNPDGTYDLVLVGIHRGIVQEEIWPVRAFRRANVRVLDESAWHDQKPDLQKVGHNLVRHVAATCSWSDKIVAAFLKGKISLSILTDVLAYHLPLETEEKLSLLAEVSPVRRALTLQKMVAPAASSTADDHKFPPDFSAN